MLGVVTGFAPVSQGVIFHSIGGQTTQAFPALSALHRKKLLQFLSGGHPG